MELAKKVMSYLVGYLYVILRFLFRRSTKVDNGCVLIILWGNIGDVLLDAKSVISLVEYYTKKGKKVTVAGKNEIKNAFEKVLGIQTIHFFVIDNGSLTLRAIKKTLSGLEKEGYETIISLLPWYNWPSLYIPACLHCNESWGAFPRQNSRALKRILSNVYNNRIIVPLDMNQMQRNKLLMKELGILGFQTEIVPIPERKQALLSANGYIVVSVDSANTMRRWKTNKFIELIDRLLKRFPYDIYLTGVNVEPDVVELYERSFAGNDRVKITIGKLSIDEWIETIRKSEFVVSLDSGSAHVAAGTGVTCFCLTGVWEGHRIMPYAVEKQNLGTKEPICVYRTDVDVETLACYACFGKLRFGWGNKECTAQCKKRLPCLCMSKITVDDVMSAIEKAEHDGEISR